MTEKDLSPKFSQFHKLIEEDEDNDDDDLINKDCNENKNIYSPKSLYKKLWEYCNKIGIPFQKIIPKLLFLASENYIENTIKDLEEPINNLKNNSFGYWKQMKDKTKKIGMDAKNLYTKDSPKNYDDISPITDTQFIHDLKKIKHGLKKYVKLNF